MRSFISCDSPHPPVHNKIRTESLTPYSAGVIPITIPVFKPMRIHRLIAFIASAVLLNLLHAQEGPFPPESWPVSINKNVTVHFVTVGDSLPAPNGNWIPSLQFLSGGDQQTADLQIGGYPAKKVTGNYLNTADTDGGYAEWADKETIDILAQVYGDSALLASSGNPRNFNFLLGTLPELTAPNGGRIPAEAKNGRWNWVLFRIPNGTRPSDGSRFVGSIPANAQGATANAGVNGGTIRMEGVPNLIIRAMAWGPQGAFGEPEAVNKFAAAETCDPEPLANYVFIDFAGNRADHLQLLNNGDQLTTIETGIGPAGDKRRAAKANGAYLNLGIVDNVLGKPCNDTRSVKICIEYFDDPALKDIASFGPEAYATDALGGVGFMPDSSREKLKGTGKWQRRSWIVPSVNLRGVNTAPLTGGPRLFFEGGPVFISRVDLAVLREGAHPLAGQDPLADCFTDPNICTGAYGDYAEMDLAKGFFDGLRPGSSGGDQEMIQEEAGPANDRRLSVRPAFNDGAGAFNHNYLNFSIENEKLGPSSQPNARLAICMTYYDSPDLVGASFRPEVYQSERNGNLSFAFTAANIAVTLEGSGTWKDAYFELPDVKFNGVNQGPQAAARFALTGKVPVSRVRYAVIRPCGSNANMNALEGCKPVTNPLIGASRTANGKVRITWAAVAAGFVLQETGSLSNPDWKAVTAPVITEAATASVEIDSGTGARFYRLVKP